MLRLREAPLDRPAEPAQARNRQRRRLRRGIPNARMAPSTAQMIITQISDRDTCPMTNETLTVSEFDTMNATSQSATSARITSATRRLRSGLVRRCVDCSGPDPMRTCRRALLRGPLPGCSSRRSWVNGCDVGGQGIYRISRNVCHRSLHRRIASAEEGLLLFRVTGSSAASPAVTHVPEVSNQERDRGRAEYD
jgi:hypothetical protein